MSKLKLLHQAPWPGVLPERHEYRLNFTKAELQVLRRACEILEDAESQVRGQFVNPSEWLDPNMVGLFDLGFDALARQLFTGDLRDLIESHNDAADGIFVEEASPP